MFIVHDTLVEVSTKALKRVDHVVNFYAVYQLSRMPQFCLNSIEFGGKFFKIRKSFQMCSLNIHSCMLVLTQKLYHAQSVFDLLTLSRWLLKILLKQPRPNLCLALVQKSIQRPRSSSHYFIVLRKHI